MKIGRHAIGPGEPLFVIAEIGLNHGGSLAKALAMVDAAAAAGVAAVKLQTVVAKDFIAPAGPRDFFAAFELDEAAHRELAARARAHGVAFISTPLSASAVALLERVGVDAYKIASGDLTFTPLIEACARTGKPVILSTGASTLEEAAAAVTAAQRAGASGVAVLHCVSSYPVPPGSENLRAIATLAAAVPVPVGLSDHAPDTSSVSIAVALGASVYERHFMLAPDDGSVDAVVSSTPDGFREVIRNAARAAAALGTGIKACLPAEAHSLVSRRGLYAADSLAAGHLLSAADVIALRPAAELTPDDLPALLGVRLRRDVAAGAPFVARDLEDSRGVA
jgi:sialic acid synthase SpsE